MYSCLSCIHLSGDRGHHHSKQGVTMRGQETLPARGLVKSGPSSLRASSRKPSPTTLLATGCPEGRPGVAGLWGERGRRPGRAVAGWDAGARPWAQAPPRQPIRGRRRTMARRPVGRGPRGAVPRPPLTPPRSAASPARPGCWSSDPALAPLGRPAQGQPSPRGVLASARGFSAVAEGGAGAESATISGCAAPGPVQPRPGPDTVSDLRRLASVLPAPPASRSL